MDEILRDIWQTALVFFSLLLFTRVLGKTQIGQLTFYEYVSGITIGSIAANVAASDPDKVWGHYIDLVFFVALTYAVSFITLKSRPLRKIIEGSPTIVIENGRIITENMRSMRYDLDELHAQLRENGILDIAEVQFGIIETTGNLSVIKKDAMQPVTRTDIGVRATKAIKPVELIMDGEVQLDDLRRSNISKDWLTTQLAIRGVNDTSEVFYAVINSQGNFFVQTYKDRKNPIH